MIGIALGCWLFLRSVREALTDPKIKPTLYLVTVLLAGGTIFYHSVEGWGWLDSFYFCVITLATVGFGDFTPETRPGKLFTIFYLFLGIGTLLALIDAVTARSMARSARFGGRRRFLGDSDEQDLEGADTVDGVRSKAP